MVDVGFGTYGSGTRNTSDSPIHSDGIGLPGGRVCSDGNNRAGIVALLGYADRYNSGTSSMSMSLGSAGTATFAIGGGGATAGNTGWQGTNLWIVSGGSASFYINFNARTQFGSGGAGTTYDGVGFTWAGTLAGAYRYIQPPTAPSITSVTPNTDGDQVTIVLGAPSDNGESGVTGYNIQRATNNSFTTGLATVSSSGTTIMTGLTPGATYYYRATARNAVTDGASVLGGAWSGTNTTVQPDPTGLGRRYNSSTSLFETADGKRYNSAAGVWEQMDGRRYNAGTTTWDPLGQ